MFVHRCKNDPMADPPKYACDFKTKITNNFIRASLFGRASLPLGDDIQFLMMTDTASEHKTTADGNNSEI